MADNTFLHQLTRLLLAQAEQEALLPSLPKKPEALDTCLKDTSQKSTVDNT